MNFDEIIPRAGTGSLKYDFGPERLGRDDLLPMWVADMDFAVPDCVREALLRTVDHRIYGYTETKEDYARSVIGWIERRSGYTFPKEALVKTPGVVFAIGMAVQAFTDPGDVVLIQNPVYYPFREVIEDNGRRAVSSDLVLKENHYEIDFEDLERVIREQKVRLMLLCSPHNPVGRVWERWELERIAELAERYDFLVVSDEIHSDFIADGHTHTIFASLSEQVAERTITCTAPTKTFNLAGLQISNIFITDRTLRRLFIKRLDAAGYSQANTFGVFACKAAYDEGEAWYREMWRYVQDNQAYFREFVARELPQLRVVRSEGTYLLWVDFRALGLSEKELQRLLTDGAHLWLDSGAIFGSCGRGFQRFNVACPRSILRQALEQLKEAVQGLSPAADR
ncbi:MAG: pyridoxal phosphate-dependent aminotransferase [Lachnospiraceae bacterium]|nr:pyridoxal phosphate-dependent aminotransferase [Lachnospiraceae bacterium]